MFKLTSKRIFLALGLASSSLVSHQVFAYPDRPITLIVGFAAGGQTDVQARALARSASKELGQPIIVANKPGLAATLGPAGMAKSSAPDGYTIAVLPATLYRIPHMQKVDFDPIKDFTRIINVTEYSYSLTINKDLPWKNVNDLIEAARKAPGEITYAMAGMGGTGHTNAEKLAKSAGVKFNAIPYKSSGEVFTAVQGGHVDFSADGGWGSVVTSGNARSLGVFSEKRLESRPDLPTLKEQGYDVVTKSSWGLGGPKGMDPKVVSILHDAFHKAMSDPAFLEILSQQDQPVAYMNGPDFDKNVEVLWKEDGEMIRELGLSPN